MYNILLMPLSLLPTKFYIPQLRPGAVARPGLVDKLATGVKQSGKFILLSGPAGFGKSTLLSEFSAIQANHISWLSLGEEDNDPTVFWTYLISSIQKVNHSIGDAALALLGMPQPLPPDSIQTILINDLDLIDDDIVLILDDYHAVKNESIHSGMLSLLEHLPQKLHPIISTRVDPPWPLARFRARDQLVEIRTQDLRFSTSEAAEFLSHTMVLNISAADITALETRTEGWIAGLQLAALSMRDRKDIPSFIKGFSGTNRYILDYLLEEVLASQPPEIQRFLLYTSILDRLTAPLCENILKGSEADSTIIDKLAKSFEPANLLTCQPILEYLERANLFVEPMDDERIWYRYHQLFADLLRARLQQTFTVQDIAALHTRAAQWYIQNGLNYEAIHHASLTSNNEWVEQLIEQNYMEMFHRGEASSMRFWTGKLSKELIYRRPWLCIYEAQSHALFGQLDEAEVLIAKAEEHLQIQNPSAETKSMLGHLAYVKSRVIGMRGDVPRSIELSLTARENTPASNQALQSGIGVNLGVAYFLNGDFINAIEVFNETIQSGIAANAINGTMAAYCHLARLYAIQGQLRKSYELYQEAGKFAHDAGGRNLGVMSLVDMGIANVLYELNDLEAALAHIKHALEFIPLWGNADDIALAYATHALIQQAQRNKADAVEAIEKGVDVIQTNGVFSEARDAVRTAQVNLWLVQGDLASAESWAADQEERLISDSEFRFVNELTRITLSRVYLARKKPDEAIRLLTRLEESAESGGRTERLIEILILKALALQIMGETAQAIAALEKSLSQAEPEGYIRIFVNEGPPMQKLLAQWSDHAGDGQLRDYSNYLQSQFNAEQHHIIETLESISLTGDLVEPLTPRELEVLKLICEGDSNQRIADKLVITVKTVKKHIGNILGKLGVTSRAQAMVKARQLELIPRDH